MGWKVLDHGEMVRNAGYHEAYKKTMTGWQNKMPPGKGINSYLVKEVMDDQALRILGPKGRDNLIKKLGVDAILTAKVSVHLNGTTFAGIGNRYPQSVLHFKLYKLGIKEPIWFEGSIKGLESKESLGKTAYFDEKKVGTLALKSAKTAFTKLATLAKTKEIK